MVTSISRYGGTSSRFGGFSVQNFFIVGAVALFFFWISTPLLKSFGVIKEGVSVGTGITILVLIVGVILAYTIVVTKRLTLESKDWVAVIIILAAIVGALVFLPDLAPELYNDAIIALQSTFGLG